MSPIPIVKVVVTTDEGKEVTFTGTGVLTETHTQGGLRSDINKDPVHYVSLSLLLPRPAVGDATPKLEPATTEEPAA